jgi:DNA-binding NarL/FixJ family response regulator
MSHGVPRKQSNGVGDGSTGKLIVLDPVIRARRGKRTAAPPAVRVLIAESQGLVRAGLRVLLEGGERIAVLGEATTGDEVVELARILRPDVVLVDVSLPGLDCVEATRRMLIDSGVAVLVLTPTESDERGFDALWAGASGLLLKDADPSELVRAVQLLAHGEALLSPSLTRRLITELTAQPNPRSPPPSGSPS